MGRTGASVKTVDAGSRCNVPETMANTGWSTKPFARRHRTDAVSSRIGPYPSARSVPAPTSTTSHSLRKMSKTRLSACPERPAESPASVAAPSMLATKLNRTDCVPRSPIA
jgi:hypothetical protein